MKNDLFICTQLALRVSGDVFAHYQEHLTVFKASDIVHLCCCRPALWTRWNSRSISSTTPAGSNISVLYHKLSSAPDDGRKHR